MTARQMFVFSYALLVQEAGGRTNAEKVLAEWSEEVKLKEMEWRAANDPTWGDTEQAQENLRAVFQEFGGPQHKKGDD